MAKKSTPSAGGIIGIILGLVVVAGIAGTPLYLAYLRADARTLDIAVQDDIETIRRVVLSLDDNLSLMSDAYESLGGEAVPDKKDMGSLLTANRELLEKAEAAVRRLGTMRQGSESAGAHLGANRIKAIFYLTAGKLHSSRAQFEESQASAMRRDAEQRAQAVAALIRTSEAIEIQKPTEALAFVEMRSRALDAELTPLRGRVTQLRGRVAEMNERLAQLEATAAEARRQLAELDSQGPLSSGDDAAYIRLSDTARAAEAEAAALQNGSIEGATALLDGGGDLLDVVYEGGTLQMGIRDLQLAIQLLNEQVEVREQAKANLAGQRAYFGDLVSRLDEQKREIDARIDDRASDIDDLLAKASQHAKAAQEARDEALVALEKKAEDFANLAINAAKMRTRDASTALRELGDAVDERLQRISRDGDTEAGMQCLAAEIAYQNALVRLNQINALQSSFETETFIANMTGRETPAAISETVEDLRGKAANYLNSALAMLGKARDQIKGTNVKASDGTTVSGSHYLWQMDVGRAAIHLLQANLAADPSERFEARQTAYGALVEAAQGREQSPLLTPAIDTLQYIQRTAR
ncbi:MAG: hypothetical protein JXQ75_19255 [Phycisphaerae bacterium]|nr:hypothetical protein [Phycisphaerae bacterium]